MRSEEGIVQASTSSKIKQHNHAEIEVHTALINVKFGGGAS